MWATFSRCLPIYPVTELWQVLAGKLAGRTDYAMVTVFASVGFALDDFAALRFMRDAAAELCLGETIDLIPEMADPKNLYAQLCTPTVAARAVRILYEPQPA